MYEGSKITFFNLKLHGGWLVHDGWFSLNFQLSAVKEIFVLHLAFDQSELEVCDKSSTQCRENEKERAKIVSDDQEKSLKELKHYFGFVACSGSVHST